jgi:hypothetical protein
MRLYRYTDFINEAKKGLQMSLFPDLVPHEQPDPEAPTEPTASAIDQDLLREYLIEMTDQGWEIEMESFLTRGDESLVEYYEMSDLLLPGENNVVLQITFTNMEDSELSPSEILYVLDNLADEAGYKTYYAPDGCPDEMKERDEIEDIDTLMLEGSAFQAYCISKLPFVAKGEDIVEYYGWRLREYSGGPSYIIKDGDVWGRLDQIDLAHIILNDENEETELIDGFDYSNHDYDPNDYIQSVLADLNPEAEKLLFEKMIKTIGGLDKLQDLIDSRTNLKTKGMSEEETWKKLYWSEDAVQRIVSTNHLLAIKVLLYELCEVYTDMLADSAAEQDSETMQNEFDEVMDKYFTYTKSDEKVTFDASKNTYTTYIYHIRITKEILEWLKYDGCTKADIETSVEEIISNYYYRRYETWKLDITKSEGWVSSARFSKRAIEIMQNNPI